MTDTPLTAEELALIGTVRLLPAKPRGELMADLATTAADTLTWEREKALLELCRFLVAKPKPVTHLLVAKEKLDAAEAEIAALTERAEKAEAQVDLLLTDIQCLTEAPTAGEWWRMLRETQARVAELEAAMRQFICHGHLSNPEQERCGTGWMYTEPKQGCVRARAALEGTR